MNGRPLIYAMTPEERFRFERLLDYFDKNPTSGCGLLAGEIVVMESLMAEYPGEYSHWRVHLTYSEQKDFIKLVLAFAITMPRSIYNGRGYKTATGNKSTLAPDNRESSRAVSS